VNERLLFAVVLALSIGVGCSSETAQNPSDAGADAVLPDLAPCGAGYKAVGPGCVPIFDDCADDEVPKLGGGCLRVGAKECPGGIAAGPDWKCEPIGPPTNCRPGWSLNKRDRVCEPALPSAPCDAHHYRQLGKATCQPLGQCGTARWGTHKQIADDVYVDASYRGRFSDGSIRHPHKTLAAGLAGAVDDARVVLAAGSYKGGMLVERSVTIVGRCAQLVHIEAKGKAVLTFAADAEVELYSLTLSASGGRAALDVTGKAEVTAEQLAIIASDGGARVDGEGVLTIRRSLVADNRGFGVLATGGGAAVVEQSELSRTVASATQGDGHGARSEADGSGETPTLTLRDTLITRNAWAGVVHYSGEALLERCWIKDHEKIRGAGIYAQGPANEPVAETTLVVRDSLIDRSARDGLWLGAVTATIEGTAVRDSLPHPDHGKWGGGIYAGYTPQPTVLTVSRSLFARNRGEGVLISSSEGSVSTSVIRDTLGSGIRAVVGVGQTTPAKLALDRTLVANNRVFGVHVAGALQMSRSVVRDTKRSVTATDDIAISLLLNCVGDVISVDDSLLQGAQLGAHLYARSNCELSVRGVVIRGTRAQLGAWDPTLSESFYWGGGIHVAAVGKGVSVAIESVAIDDCASRGVALFDVDAELRDVVVRDVRRDPDGSEGLGVLLAGIDRRPAFDVERLNVRRASIAGVLLQDGVLQARGLWVESIRGGRQLLGEERLGFGVVAISAPAKPSSIELSKSLVDTSEAAIGSLNSTGQIQRCLLRRSKVGLVRDGAALPLLRHNRLEEVSTPVVDGLVLSPPVFTKLPGPQ
jgi:hypothetical protein